MRTRTAVMAVLVALLASSCTAWTWGRALDFSTPTADSPGWLATSKGDTHTCRIDVSSRLWCRGNNSFGQLGDGTAEDRDEFVLVDDQRWLAVETANISTCGIRSDRTLWCWGHTGDGSVGPDPQTDEWAPVQIGHDADWTTIEGTWVHWCGLRVDGSLWCWGWNEAYQVGNGDTEFVDAPTHVGSAEWISVGTGLTATCGVREDHSLWCWGVDLYGETGHDRSELWDHEFPTPTQVGTELDWRAVSLSEFYSCAIKVDGTLWCWGDYSGSSAGAVADVPTRLGTATTWRRLDVGHRSACGIQTDNSMWCWGSNLYGAVGDGTVDDRPEPVQIGAGEVWIDVSVATTVDALSLNMP